METKTRIEPVLKYYFEVTADEEKNIADLNCEIRNWLAQNCGCTWETDWVRDTRLNISAIGVYFDMDTVEEDLMAFKLRWS